MRPLIVLSVVAIAFAGPAVAQKNGRAEREAAEQRKLDAALAGLTPGKPLTCLPQVGRPQMQTQGYGPTILYRVGRNLVYRTDTSGGCERMARGDALVTNQVGGQLCSGTIATTFDTVARFQTGSCSFGPFIPYRRK